MGDRGNIKITGAGPHPIYLYTHHGGSELDAVLRTVLARRARWGEYDGSYLARMIFSEMIKNEVGSEYGYGISTDITDNEHAILHVNVNKKTVSRETEDGYLVGEAATCLWTYEQYLALDPDQGTEPPDGDA